MTVPSSSVPPVPDPARSDASATARSADASPRRLIVLDVDSTFITAEVIELLAAHNGTVDQVAAVTEAAMRGEIDFGHSLAERVRALAGLPESVFEDVFAELQVSPGGTELVAEAHARGWVVALVSGGFEELVGPLAKRHGITYFLANNLEVSDGVLTGRTSGPVIDRAAKAVALREFAAAEGIPLEHTVAIGDGANDLDMIAAAGIGVAFNAKPLVREQAPFTIDERLDRVIALLDDQA